MRGPLTTLLLALASATPAASPEVQFCLQHLRPSERARAEAALGPLDKLPLYLADLDVDPQGRSVRGHVRLEYPVGATPPKSLFLRSTPNAFDGGAVKLRNLAVDGRPARAERPEPSLFEIPLAPAPQANATVTVTLDLEAKVPKGNPADESLGTLSLGGSGQRGDHGAFSAYPDVVSLVGVLPVAPHLDARGEPVQGPTGLGDLAAQDPANYLVSVAVPAGWTAVAPGVALGVVPERSRAVRFSFAAAVVRDFPVVVARGLSSVSKAAGDVTVESYFFDRHRRSGQQALDSAVKAVAQLERRLGPLPHTTLRLVEAPLTGGAGGMEFQGMITLARSLYAASQDPSTLAGVQAAKELDSVLASQGLPPLELGLGNLQPMMERTLEFTVDHELAHQYFAGLVGSDPVANPVADESLAQYVAVLLIEWGRGSDEAEELVAGQLVASYQFYRMTGGEDGAADRPTDEFGSELEYAALIYGKAPLLHREERRLVGDDAYLRALRAYVDEYRYRWACGDCFSRTLGRLFPSRAKDLRLLRRRWWEEAHGDEDLGAADMSAMLKKMGGGALTPEALELLKELLP